MALFNWLRSFGLTRPPLGVDRRTQPQRFRPCVETLEGRVLPSTLTVLNTNDSGPGSLRAAIAAAQNGDTIAFDPSLNGQAINLTSGQLVIEKSLAIEGPGTSAYPFREALVVSTLLKSRIFDVLPGANVTIANLYINGGEADQGGLIYNAGALTLKGCYVNAGFALGDYSPADSGGPGMGGAIYNAAGASLAVIHSGISGNSAYGGDADQGFTGGNGMGGAIYEAGGVVVISDSSLDQDDAEGGEMNIPPSSGDRNGSSLGGAIYVAGGVLQLANSQVDAVAGMVSDGPGAGGAIYQAGGNVSISNSSVSGAVFGAFSAQGGAIFQTAGTMSLTNCLVGGEAANFSDVPAQGGGIYQAGGTMSLTNCHLIGTPGFSLAQEGGAIYQADGLLNVTNCTFFGNSVSGPVAQGGAIYIAGGSLDIQNSTFQNNAAIGTDDLGNVGGGVGDGGAIYIAGGTVCISKNTTFAGDFASTSNPDVFGPFTLC
jgi:hypothetical protein